MDLALTTEDIERLTDVQKLAVLDSLFIALIADGAPAPEKVERFDEAMASLPWKVLPGELVTRTSNIAVRLATSEAAGKLAFVRETATNIPQDLRERVIRSMVAIVSADHTWTYGERSTLASFVEIFGLTTEQIEQLRQETRAEAGIQR